MEHCYACGDLYSSCRNRGHVYSIVSLKQKHEHKWNEIFIDHLIHLFKTQTSVVVEYQNLGKYTSQQITEKYKKENPNKPLPLLRSCCSPDMEARYNLMIQFSFIFQHSIPIECLYTILTNPLFSSYLALVSSQNYYNKHYWCCFHEKQCLFPLVVQLGKDSVPYYFCKHLQNELLIPCSFFMFDCSSQTVLLFHVHCSDTCFILTPWFVQKQDFVLLLHSIFLFSIDPFPVLSDVQNRNLKNITEDIARITEI